MSRLVSPALAVVLALPLLSGCSLFGDGPKQHTVVDYHSLEPGHGADTPPRYPYGHTAEKHNGTGINSNSIYPPSPSDSTDD